MPRSKRKAKKQLEKIERVEPEIVEGEEELIIEEEVVQGQILETAATDLMGLAREARTSSRANEAPKPASLPEGSRPRQLAYVVREVKDELGNPVRKYLYPDTPENRKLLAENCADPDFSLLQEEGIDSAGLKYEVWSYPKDPFNKEEWIYPEDNKKQKTSAMIFSGAQTQSFRGSAASTYDSWRDAPSSTADGPALPRAYYN